MSHKLPKLTAILLIVVLVVPMFLTSSGAVPAVQAQKGDVATANDAVASKIHPKLQAAVAAAALTDAFDVIVYAQAGTDLSHVMSNVLVRKYVLPNGTQTYFGRAQGGQCRQAGLAARRGRYHGSALPGRPAAVAGGPRSGSTRTTPPQPEPWIAELEGAERARPRPRPRPTRPPWLIGSTCSTSISPRPRGIWATRARASRCWSTIRAPTSRIPT